jgi:hypothetical protein
LQHPVAQELLSSKIPARLAYVARDGTPRVVPIWFHWNGKEIVLGTPPKAPKVQSLKERPKVALTILRRRPTRPAQYWPDTPRSPPSSHCFSRRQQVAGEGNRFLQQSGHPAQQLFRSHQLAPAFGRFCVEEVSLLVEGTRKTVVTSQDKRRLLSDARAVPPLIFGTMINSSTVTFESST